MNRFGTSTLADVPIEFTVLSKNPSMFVSFSVSVPCFSLITRAIIIVIYRYLYIVFYLSVFLDEDFNKRGSGCNLNA